jgi:hypothetical protein
MQDAQRRTAFLRQFGFPFTQTCVYSNVASRSRAQRKPSEVRSHRIQSRSKAMQRPYSPNDGNFGDYNRRKYMIAGITLAVITGFRRLASNSVVSEMLKHLPNNNLQVSGNCWRNTLQHEIDYLEPQEKELRAWKSNSIRTRVSVSPFF